MTKNRPIPEMGQPKTVTVFTSPSSLTVPRELGGGERSRTDDLLLAKQALSQLSYTPLRTDPRRLARHRNWWAGEDLNLRPHAYQARALTS